MWQRIEVHLQFIHTVLHAAHSAGDACGRHNSCRLEHKAHHEQWHVGFTDLALPAQMLEAIAHRDYSQQRNRKVEDATGTAKESLQTQHAHRQNSLGNNQHADDDLHSLLPTVMLPLW